MQVGSLMRSIISGSIILMLFSLCLLVPVKAEPCAILKVSLPDGAYVGFDSDPWLNECWLLNLTGSSQTFTVKINNTSAAKRSYDTHLIITLNDVSYHNLENLVVNSTVVPKSAFQYGYPKPYNLWNWPSGDVYPTWFNDTYVNIGTVPRKGYKDVIVSVTFSNATDARMHFDAYGTKIDQIPTSPGYITHNAPSEDSTVLLQPGPPEPQPPIPKLFFNPSYPNTDVMVVFNASKSYDPDGNIISYSWDFGDGTPIVVESDPIANHTYTSFGNYTVTLTVTDNDGLVGNTTCIVNVRQPPVATFTYLPSDPLENEVLTFDASASTPDGGVLISYEWDFGDGNITTVTYPVINYTHATFGNYTVTLNVTDSEGKWDTESKSITVEALPIADFWWSPQHPVVCENVTFDASDSTPDGGVLIDYTWDFGDGTPVVIENDPIITHHYTANGSFTVTLNITDSEGRWDTESKIITVSPLRFYLIVKTDPDGITPILGEGWYENCTYVDLAAPSFIPSVTGVNGQRYRFNYWDVDGVNVSGNPITVHMGANHTATAHYILQYYLTVKTNPQGIVAIQGEGWYDESTNVSLTASSVAGYDFLYWDVDGVSKGSEGASIFVAMGSPHVATAHYRQEQVIVGGSTISIKSPLLGSWISLNAVLTVIIFSIALGIKKLRKETT